MQILCNNAVWEDKGLLREKPLNVNFTQSDTLLSALPCLPIASSHTVGWNKIQLAHYRQPAHSIPEHCSPYHTICINVGSSVLLDQLVDGHFEAVHSVPGDIGLYPANLSQTFCWDREAEFLQLYLEPTLFTLVSYELCGSDRVELVPQLTTLFDPLIKQIGLALKTALETDGLGSRLYAESMANAVFSSSPVSILNTRTCHAGLYRRTIQAKFKAGG